MILVLRWSDVASSYRKLIHHTVQHSGMRQTGIPLPAPDEVFGIRIANTQFPATQMDMSVEISKVLSTLAYGMHLPYVGQTTTM